VEKLRKERQEREGSALRLSESQQLGGNNRGGGNEPPNRVVGLPDDGGPRESLSDEKPREDRNEFANMSMRSTFEKDLMVGNPIYQVFRCLDYQMQFNNQNSLDEMNAKLLLVMPMVPKKHLGKIKLNHLKLYKVNNSHNSKNPEEYTYDSNLRNAGQLSSNMGENESSQFRSSGAQPGPGRNHAGRNGKQEHGKWTNIDPIPQLPGEDLGSAQ